MRSFQASKRTGFMDVELKEGKLQIQGQAVIVFEGRLAI
jgi:predicted PhzF superfamily epimerase YddE/YHI9